MLNFLVKNGKMKLSRESITENLNLILVDVPTSYVYVVVNFLSQVIFVFLLFLGMVMYANEIETKEK